MILLRALYVVCAAVSGTALVAMVLVSFVDSIGRQLSMPLAGAGEIVSFTMCIFFFASLALVTRHDAHIRVGLVAELYPDHLRRKERNIVGVLEILCMLVFSWMVIDQASRLYRFGTQTGYFEMPVYPAAFAAAVLSLIAICFAVENVFHHHREARPRPHAIPDMES